MEIHISPTKQTIAKEFAAYLIRLFASGEVIRVALSGGSTPKLVFRELVGHHASKIDWSRIELYWGDERCVPPSDNESNYKMTADFLLNHIDIPERNVFRIMGEAPPAEEAERYGDLLRRELPQTGGIPQFDLVILGMGEDGHTASIFPGSEKLWYSPEPCAVAGHPISGQKRITITGRIINNAREVAFLVTGAEKSEKVREVIHAAGSYIGYPAALVAPVSGRLHWFLDHAAAGSLTSG